MDYYTIIINFLFKKYQLIIKTKNFPYAQNLLYNGSRFCAFLRIKNGEKWRETEYGTDNSAGGR